MHIKYLFHTDINWQVALTYSLQSMDNHYSIHNKDIYEYICVYADI